MVRLSPKLLKENPTYFAENILNVQLHKGQKEVLECSDRFIAVVAPRRWGKSLLEACYACWLAATNENCRIICVSKSKRQADEIFQKIHSLIVNSVLVHSLKRQTLSKLEFDNGSVVESMPSRSPENLRGMTISLCILDEGAFIPDSVYQALFPVILNVKGKELGKLVIISSPGRESGEFYRAFQPGSIYTHFEFNHTDAIFDDGSRLLSEEELDREAERVGGRDTPYFKREYLGLWANTDNSFFDSEGLEKALVQDLPQIKYGLPNHRYFLGVDLALSKDFTVIVCIDATDKENLKIVNTERFTGKSTDKIVEAIYKKAVAFHPKTILIDDAKIGRSVLDYLRIDHKGYNWQAFNFNSASKIPLLIDLNLAMCTGILQIPDDPQIREELINFYYEENANTGHLKVEGANSSHDDFPIAISLALRASGVITKRGGNYIIGSNKGILKPPKDSEYHPNKFAKVLHY